MSEIEILTGQLKAIWELVNLLTPNSMESDIEILENKVDEGQDLIKKTNELNIFSSLEKLILSNEPHIVEQFVKGQEMILHWKIKSWEEDYNEHSFKLSRSSSQYLYKTGKLKSLINGTQGLLHQVNSELMHFIKHYFPAYHNELLPSLYPVKDMKEQPNKENTSTPRTKKSYKAEIWFKVGLLFATGKIAELTPKYTINKVIDCAKITKEIGEPKYNKYILATLNLYTESNTDKNFYYKDNHNKRLKVYNHCKENNIQMTTDFEALILLE